MLTPALLVLAAAALPLLAELHSYAVERGLIVRDPDGGLVIGETRALAVTGSVAILALAFWGGGGIGAVIGGGGGSGKTPVTIDAPDTPSVSDVVTFASNGDSSRVVGSSFSGDQADSHDSTKIQVDTAGGDFSSPQYHDVVLGALTADTVLVDSGAVAKARIAYKGAQGGWSAWSDSLQFTAEVIEAGAHLFSDGFESGDRTHEENGYSWSGDVMAGPVDDEDTMLADTEGASPHSGSHASRWRVPSGTQQNRGITLAGPALSEYWFEYWVRIPNQYNKSPGGNDKWVEFYHEGTRETGDNNTLVWAEMWDAAGGDARLSRNTYGDSESGHDFSATSPAIDISVHQGTWRRWRYHVHIKAGGTLLDMEIWNGSNKIYTLVDEPITWDDGLDAHTEFQIMGWNNTLFANDLTWYVDDVKLYGQDPGW